LSTFAPPRTSRSNMPQTTLISSGGMNAVRCRLLQRPLQRQLDKLAYTGLSAAKAQQQQSSAPMHHRKQYYTRRALGKSSRYAGCSLEETAHQERQSRTSRICHEANAWL
jgi:hypothetical protein